MPGRKDLIMTGILVAVQCNNCNVVMRREITEFYGDQVLECESCGSFEKISVSLSITTTRDNQTLKPGFAAGHWYTIDNLNY